MGSVFLSYRHESDAHRLRVREFAEQLRASGLEVVLDQFFEDAHPGGPGEGWDRWSVNSAKQAGKIVIIGSPGWFRCFEGTEEPGKGCGAASEARIIFRQLHNAKWESNTHRIVYFDAALQRVPTEIEHFPYFVVGGLVSVFDRLVAWLKGEASPAAATGVIWPTPLAHFAHDLADRNEAEWPAVIALLSGQSTARILLFEGPTNHGKSELVKQSVAYARQAGIRVATLDFKGRLKTVEDALGVFHLELGDLLPGFLTDGGTKPHLLRKDLRALRQPVLIVLDAYEEALKYPDLADWLEHQLLAETQHSRGVAFIVAGQKTPALPKAPWRDFARLFPIGPIPQKYWEEWLAKKSPELVAHVKTLVMLTNGVPGNMAVSLNTIATYQQRPS